jgi:aspartyl aminopeptidase
MQATPKQIAVMAVFDNEEVGSSTKQGADSTFLYDVLSRIALGFNMNLLKMLPSSLLASCDNGHGIHPNHPELSDKNHAPKLNNGVVIKYNANQKYTSDGISAALFKKILKKASIPYQEYCNRADMRGGGTLGNISTSHVSINSVDIGLAQLAMHSIYETAGAKDTLHMVNALKAFFESSIIMTKDGSYNVE